jgi:hypothetical protein
MAIGVMFDFPQGSLDQYDEICRGLTGGEALRRLSDWPGGGCLSHAVMELPGGGIRVFDVWETAEDFQRFGETLGPLVAAAGLEGQPQVAPLHNFVNA